MDSITDHSNKASHNIFAGAEFCLQLVKNTTRVKYNKVECNKMTYACRENGDGREENL